MKNSSWDVFALLLYKNYLSRKRRWILTVILEIAIPLFIFANIWNVGGLLSNFSSEEEIHIQKNTGLCKAKLFVIPNNPFTIKVAERMDYCLINKMSNLTYNDSKINPCQSVEAETNTFDSEDDLLKVYQSFYPRKQDKWSGYAFTATLIFQNQTAQFDSKNLKYKLKVPYSLPKELYDKPSNNSDDLIYERGYAAFQLCVDEEFIKMKKNNPFFEVQINSQEMPNPIYVKPDIMNEKFRQLFVVIAVIVLLVPLCVETFFVSNEQSVGVNMLISLNNVPYYLNLLSWLISGLIISLLYTIPIAVLSNNHSSEDTLAFLHYGNPFIFWIMLTLNVAHLIMFGVHVSAYFTMPHFSIVTIIILYASSTVILICGTDENTVGILPVIGIIFPNILLFRACEEFNYYEKMEKLETGISWSNMFEAGNEFYGVQGSVGMVLVFSVLGIIFHFAMANYVYAINPLKYGVKKSPFSFIKFLMNMKKPHDCNRTQNNENEHVNSKLLQPTEENCIPEIRIRKLTKSYRISTLNRVKKCALGDVSIDILGKQTTVLLGYSGSGKTTLLSTFTGSFNPSEGFVLINGKNVQNASDKLGFCLQKNIFFPDLSVFEHLSFFNMLKNSSKSKCVVDAEVTSLLDKLKLSKKSNALPKGLSIAQKRRLCLGIALIGNPKILILDEPTLDLDAENKRDVWNLLLRMHGEKTIIVSTRDLEEAEVLGDRIAILHEGELKCYGTANFLKESLGKVNVQVTLATGPNCELENISDYFDPKSKVIEISHGQIILSVPDNNDLPDSLDKIEHHKKELDVKGINVSNINLAKIYQAATRSNSAVSPSQEFCCTTNERLDDKNDILKALVCKKAIYTINNIAPILMIIIMFFASLLCASLVLVSKPESKQMQLPVKPYLYGNVTAYYKYNNNNIAAKALAGNYSEIMINEGSKAVELEFDMGYMHAELQQLAYGNTAFNYTYHNLFAAAFQVTGLFRNEVNATALYNTYRARFTLPISINLVSNAVLKTVVGFDHDIETTYEEMALFKEDIKVDHLTKNAIFDSYIVATILTLFIFPAMALFVIHPLRESLSNVKYLQKIAGVSGVAYWGIIFAFDFFIFLIISVFFIAKFVIMDVIFDLDLFGWQEILILLMLMILFAKSALPLIYAFSFWKKSASYTIAVLSLLPLGLVLLDFSVSYVLRLDFFKDNEFMIGIRSFQKFMFMLTPYGSFFHAQHSFFNNTIINSECRKVTNLANDRVCDLTPCCNMKCVDGACSNAVSYFKNFGDDMTLGTSVLFMCLTPILYFTILGILEFKLIPKLLGKINLKKINETDEAIENQVKKVRHEIAFEASKIRENVTNGTITNGNLTSVENGTEASSSVSREKKTYEFFVFELKKMYGKLGVKNVSFGIQRNECFGLLGASNSGKTTILKMIAGKEIPDHGMIYLRGERCPENVGYCPQNSSLIKTLNAYDHLRLFARLRGIPDRRVDREVTKWIERFDLNDCASEPCETYSASNKKRLNIAMALIGHPKLVLLDEPTKNLDPLTKLFLWKIIQSCQASGQSILLTSTSMEECFILCKNIAVMDNGKFAYVGSSEDLKQRFGSGYDVQIKLKFEISKDEVDALTKSMTEILPCEIISENPESMKFYVMPVEITWRQIYDSLSEMKAEYSCIKEFSVVTSSSEQLFSVFIKPVNEINF